MPPKIMPPQSPMQVTERDEELLSAYLDNQLSAAARVQLEDRLKREPALRSTLNELRAMVQLLGEQPALSPPRSFTLDPAKVPPQRWSWSSLRLGRIGGSLAALTLVLLLGVPFLLNNLQPANFESAQPAALAPQQPSESEMFGMGGAPEIDSAADTARACRYQNALPAHARTSTTTRP